ncbi:hypothetical protein E2493_16950 [Sphingomonas parva]|uniref:Tetratricopeptide repeat protein n=1 Tax=Sphingomonas parva TaxID=2555898 RepID=A0A4Y8ZM64_9SPHN|nr:hypothetical protein [Sphingomonas parva]TFI57044.1 hypothetical protein E2493_16950 [Sphingomonas parva]
MRSVILAAAAAMLLAPGAAPAGTPVTQKMTCPIGGKAFDFRTTASYTTFGTRADGKPFGSWTFPLALPECPDNGLVLYKDYAPEEVARLEPLVASEAYQALRREDTQYYRAYWLMKEMGLGPERYLWALLQASWEADDRPPLRARYLAELAEASASVPAKPDDLNWIGMEGRAVNALRELGRFDEALARLEKVTIAPPAPLDMDQDEGKSRAGWIDYFAKQKLLIARADASSDPFELLPRREALARCAEGTGLDAHKTAWCDAAKDDVAALKAKKDSLEQELETIGRKRDSR